MIVAVLLVHLIGVIVIGASTAVLVPMLFIIIRAAHVLKTPWALALYPGKGKHQPTYGAWYRPGSAVI